MTNDNTSLKRCKVCLESFPPTTEYFHKAKGCRDGLRPECKKCRKVIKAAAYARDREVVLEKQAVYRKENAEKIKERNRRYHKKNKEKLNKKSRDHYANNIEHYAESSRIWRENNKERKTEMDRIYRETQGEVLKVKKRVSRLIHIETERRSKRLWLSLNFESKAKADKAWREANPDRVNQYSRDRRARKKQAIGTFTLADVLKQLEAQKHRCWWCHKKLPKKGWEVDHRLPLSKFMLNDASNIVIAHRKCNRSKGAKMPWEFMEGRLL